MTTQFLLVATITVLLLACKKTDLTTSLPAQSTATQRLKKENLAIAVVSDIHYTDPKLFTNGGIEGKAFQDYLAQDPKLLTYSDPIFRRVLADLKANKPDVLLVPGDLTKDGEWISHQSVAAFFQDLKQQGIHVYVVPGNHDVANPEASTYNGDNASPAPNVSAAQFSTLYADFGYSDASHTISRDPASLSYVAQIASDLWLLGIDACRYEDNTDKATTPGRIKPKTLGWILNRLADARKQNITVFAMMHHNLVEHYTNQSLLDPGYVIEDWQNVTEKLMEAGLRIIFTGHYHASDITRYEKSGKELFDIETGSLVTAPLPYRRIRVKNKDLEIATEQVSSIDSNLPDGVNLQGYANSFLSGHLDAYFSYLLTTPAFGAPQQLADYAAPIFRKGIMAHMAGDEKISPAQQTEIQQLGTRSPDLAGIVNLLWTDLPVKDNREVVKYRE